ncbi:MAG: glycoside hydrolase N-terminal domain-containing protein [Lentisphaeria bacterium]|nr:glycoside hydrolase N-terminal domain-containing protein [Lentisphaeria bacterium]
MKKILLAAFAFLAALSVASAADLLLRQDAPAKDWESQYFPIGNGALGAMLNGGIAEDILQLNLDSLWSGSAYSTEKLKDNPDANYAEMGCYLPLGTLKVKFDGVKDSEVKDYSRVLDIGQGFHTVEFEAKGGKQTRTAFSSALSGVLVYHVSSETPVSGRVEYRDGREGITVIEGIVYDAPPEWGNVGLSTRTTKYYADGFAFSGIIPEEFRKTDVPDRYPGRRFEEENALNYEVRARVVADGWLRTAEDGVEFKDCRELTVLLAAESDYNPKLVEFTREEKTAKLALPDKRIADAAKMGYAELKRRNSNSFSFHINNVALDLGGDPELEKLTLAQRVKRCREGKSDPGLVALMFQYGRYLLLSSSARGTLPANLQGIWNNSNSPAWHSDYHTNINIQMNYWGAEPAGLAECHEPLFDFMLAAMHVAAKDTETVLGEDSGFTFRTSMNSYGAGGWRWNWPSAAWIAQHFYRHWQYGADRKFLEQKAWPFYEGVAKFWFKRLKKRADGTYVVPQGWSPEHGPTEDGVTHDQQIVAEFFDQYLDIARELEIENDDTKRAAEIRKNLLGNKIGSWGQLQEWETDRDRKGDDHRHTSHLFAVYPGSSIDAVKTPELFKAARVALEGRALTGDARRSWTWPWRAALWARLGDGEKATEMVNSLLRYNTLENLFTTHPPFQIDGNLGIVGAICEMLVQNDSGGVFVLPVELPDWPNGSFHGLRVHGGDLVSAEWKDGRLVKIEFKVRHDGEMKLRTRTPMVWNGQEGTSFTIPLKKWNEVVLTAPEP